MRLLEFGIECLQALYAYQIQESFSPWRDFSRTPSTPLATPLVLETEYSLVLAGSEVTSISRLQSA
jgi:hypothetical protein